MQKKAIRNNEEFSFLPRSIRKTENHHRTCTAFNLRNGSVVVISMFFPLIFVEKGRDERVFRVNNLNSDFLTQLDKKTPEIRTFLWALKALPPLPSFFTLWNNLS